MRKLKVINKTKGTVVATQADVADTSQKRRAGLLRHGRLEAGQGLWIAPCEAIHTFGMRFPIDVLFLDRRKKVLKVKAGMPRGRIAASLWAHSVLELPEGQAERTRTEPGDVLEFENVVATADQT
jgi:uncharacterized membrane protein (UPF0127 family)